MEIEFQISNLGERYEMKKLLGTGGMATVYKAWDNHLQRNVAIKRLHNADASDSETIQSMWKEAMTTASIQHPNILTIYDFGIDEQGPYVIMEFIDGKTVEELVDNDLYDLESFRDAIFQTLNALVSAHRVNLLHRDLKPQNIMASRLLSGGLQYKILDFGLAKFAAKPTEQTVKHDMIRGSVYYMSPEQLLRQPLDIRSDIYSMGCVYYYMLTGHLAFNGENLGQVVASHLQHTVVPLQEIRADLPNPILNWVMKMIRLDAAKRPQTAEEAAESFKQAMAHAERPKTISFLEHTNQRQSEEPVASTKPRLVVKKKGPTSKHIVKKTGKATVRQRRRFGSTDLRKTSSKIPRKHSSELSSRSATSEIRRKKMSTGNIPHDSRRSAWWLGLLLVMLMITLLAGLLYFLKEQKDRKATPPSPATPQTLSFITENAHLDEPPLPKSNPFKGHTHVMFIQFKGYEDREPLVDFPVLITLNRHTSGLDYRQFADEQGRDLRFCDAQGKRELAYETEQWNILGNSHIWVKVPVLRKDTYIWAYWGNPSPQPVADKTSVWDKHYRAVWHMNDDKDATDNKVIVETSGIIKRSTKGVAGGAMDFLPQPSYMNTRLSLNTSDDNTISGWVLLRQEQRMCQWVGSYFTNYCYTGIDEEGKVVYGYANTETTGNKLPEYRNAWLHWALVAKQGKATMFLQGKRVGTCSYQGQGEQANTLFLGARQGNGSDDGIPSFHLNGLLDEVRISAGKARSEGWIKACFYNQANNTAFTTCGSVRKLK